MVTVSKATSKKLKKKFRKCHGSIKAFSEKLNVPYMTLRNFRNPDHVEKAESFLEEYKARLK